MRRFSASLVMLLVAVTSVHGQVLASHSSPGPEAVRPIATTFHSNVSTIDGCPVGLFADRRSDMEMVRVHWAFRENGPAQGLHISFVHLVTPSIESAEITVYGVTSRPNILPVGAASNEISKTFTLHPGEGSKGAQEATVWMYRVGALTRVELNSLTYADGSVWHESDGSKCRAVPNPFLLVGER
jgi:hypothetical protein